MTVDEILVGINIALGAVSLQNCPTFDCNSEGQVTVDCILQAVNNALEGCSVPTPTPDVPALATQIPEQPHDRVTSSDGRATLLIPEGALPEGVDVSQIRLAPVDASAQLALVDAGKPIVAYELSPDGLRFAGPVLLQITTEAPANGSVPGVLLASADELIPISPELADVELADQSVTLTVAIFHFSVVVVAEGPFLVSVLVPGDVFTVGESFTSIASVDRIPGFTRTFVLDLPFGLLDAEVSYDGDASLAGSWEGSSRLTPRFRGNAPAPTLLAEGATLNSTQDFTCNTAGPAAITYEAVLVYNETVDKDLFPFPFRVGQQDSVRVTSEPFECREPLPTPTPTPIRIGRLDAHITTNRGCIESGSGTVVNPGDQLTVRFEVESEDFPEAGVTIVDRLADGVERIFFQGTLPTNQIVSRTGTVTPPFGRERLRLEATNGEAMSTDECSFEVEGVTCGGILGTGCAGPTFCEFPSGSCGAGDALGTCTLIPGTCPPFFNPVCGCDETTYDNDCFRQQAGVAKNFDGDCEQEE